MDEYSSNSRIIRKSIFTFLQRYQYFTSTPALLVFPFAISCLLLQAFVPSSLLSFFENRFSSLFLAAGFPLSSGMLFNLLNLKLSQTIVGYIFLLPYSISFLLLAKAYVIKSLSDCKHTKEPSFSSWIKLYKPLLCTQICSSLVILGANATCFSLLVFAFNFLDVLGLSCPLSSLFISIIGGVIYSIILANAYIVCNLAMVLSGVERQGGYLAILKACVLIKGRAKTALALAVTMNMALVAVEALFQYRVMGADRHVIMSTNLSVVFEAMIIAYIYGVVLVIDTIVGCIFFRSCKEAFKIDQEDGQFVQIQIEDVNVKSFSRLSTVKELP